MGKGRPKKTELSIPVPIIKKWKTFEALPPHGEIVYVKNKKSTKDTCVKRMGKEYIDNKENKVDVTQFTHWRLVY